VIDLLAAHLALRGRATGLVIATTGSVTLSATPTGFARAAGSFLDDGFVVGMEIASSGFAQAANNGVGVVVGVTDLALAVSMFVVSGPAGVQTITRPATVVDPAAAGRTITAGFPSFRAWENKPLEPGAGIPYVEEDFVPATHKVLTAPANTGLAEETGLYVLKWYGVPEIGVAALRKSNLALAKLFAPGTNLAAGADVVRMRSDTAVFSGQVLQMSTGWAVLKLTIPWRAYSANVVAP